MALLGKATSPVPSPSTKNFDDSCRVGSGLICGEDIDPGAPCYIGSDGLVYMSGGSGVSALTAAGAQIHGWSPIGAKVAQNDAITLLTNIDFHYGSGLTPGARYYLYTGAATKGRLETAVGSAIANSRACAFAIDATRIRVTTVIY